MTWLTSGMSCHASGLIWAAHPVTIIWASGLSRCNFRKDWRACFSASDVTAQVLMIIAFCKPAASACLRITSDSQIFNRQPNVSICGRLALIPIPYHCRHYYDASRNNISLSAPSRAPRNAVSAGPRIKTRPSSVPSSTQLMNKLPPSRTTSTLRPVSPRR